ncbi:antibiotic biosynthesis monooxygenase [Pseudomonas cichorii]|nr:putative quinol monooxygenase [Pseudomonas cichorii]MBX8519791.1 antibiotic biosynthesis monooxygenase [Pseudomonas cichorii]MBX8564917.1 antibiotic biosynthesis monooxygenase [Pseudomonas cichorii]
MVEIIYIVAHVIAEEPHLKEVQEALLKAVDATQCEEGCLQYELFQNADNFNQWTILEIWKSEQALVKHAGGIAFRTLKRNIEGKAKLIVHRLLPVYSEQPSTNADPEFWMGNGLP